MSDLNNKDIAPAAPAMSKAESKGFEPTIPVGIFLSIFGVVVIGAAFLEMSATDKWINTVSGLVLVAVGVFCYVIGWARKRRRTK